MRARLLVVVSILVVGLVATGAAHADHAGNQVSGPVGLPADVPFSKSGDWTFVGNFPMGPGAVTPLGTDVETFVRDGKTYAIVGSMTVGFRLFRYDALSPTTRPVPVSDYSSAFPCTALNLIPALLGNKIENDEDLTDTLAPVGGWQDDVQVNGNGTLAGIATDADGRCHDTAGAGLELVDISDLARPRLFHLTRHFGEAHNTTFDKARGLVYISSSDTQLNAIDIVDIRSCVPPAADPARFAACRPKVARYQFPLPHALAGASVNVPPAFKDPRHPEGLTAGRTEKSNNGCHDITVQGNFLYCAAVNATVIFDASGVTQRNVAAGTRRGGQDCVSLTDPSCVLTGTHLTDQAMIDADKSATAVGLPPACPVIDGTPAVGKPASVTDCEDWNRPTSGSQASRYEQDDFIRANLRNANLRPVFVFRHAGIGTTESAREDIEISHEADPTEDGTMLMITDERGGGLQHLCGTGDGGGGVWFYDIRDKERPKLLRQPDGSKAVFISRRVPHPGNCTVHVIQQVPGRNIIAAGWYINGTHVFGFEPDLGAGTVRFAELGHYIPGTPSPQTWTSAVIGVANGRLYLQTGDMTRGTDILAFTLPPDQPGVRPPPPPQPGPNACPPARTTPREVPVGRATKVTVSVRYRGRPVRRAVVTLRGAGVRATTRTDRRGIARVTVRPTRPGVIRVRTPASCHRPTGGVGAVRPGGGERLTGRVAQ